MRKRKVKKTMEVNTKNKILILLQGCPGAGKSTWVKENNLESFTLCKDTFRIMAGCVSGGEILQSCNKLVRETIYMFLEARLKNGKFTVIDETNIFYTTVKKYSEMAAKYGFKVIVIKFNADIDTLFQRNVNRGYKRVPENLIENMYDQMRKYGYRGKTYDPSEIKIVHNDEVVA